MSIDSTDLPPEELKTIISYNLTAMALLIPDMILKFWLVQYFWNQIIVHLTHLGPITFAYAVVLTIALNVFNSAKRGVNLEKLSDPPKTGKERLKIATNTLWRLVGSIISKFIFFGIIWFVTN